MGRCKLSRMVMLLRTHKPIYIYILECGNHQANEATDAIDAIKQQTMSLTHCQILMVSYKTATLQPMHWLDLIEIQIFPLTKCILMLDQSHDWIIGRTRAVTVPDTQCQLT